MKLRARNSGLDRISDWKARARQAGYRVKQLAYLCRCTPRQLERYFGDKFRIAPHAWMDQVRLRDAQARLSSGELAKNVTGQIGFAHAPHLSYWCKRLSGQSPGAIMATLAKDD